MMDEGAASTQGREMLIETNSRGTRASLLGWITGVPGRKEGRSGVPSAA
jgi:hypothetical protein